jgi:hypothetical protein
MRVPALFSIPAGGTTSLHHPALPRIIKADRLLIITGFGYLPMSRAQANFFIRCWQLSLDFSHAPAARVHADLH